jgi:hypothetical protein
MGSCLNSGWHSSKRRAEVRVSQIPPDHARSRGLGIAGLYFKCKRSPSFCTICATERATHLGSRSSFVAAPRCAPRTCQGRRMGVGAASRVDNIDPGEVAIR